MSSSCHFLQMVTRTKKIFVGGLSANTVVEDVKQYFEQFGKVSSAWVGEHIPDQLVEEVVVVSAFATAVSSRTCPRTWPSKFKWNSAGAETEEPGLWLVWCPTCLQEQTEWSLSVVVLAFAGHVGPGLGAGGGSDWGGMRD